MKKQLQQQEAQDETEGKEALGAFSDDLVAMARGVETKVTERLPKRLAIRIPTLIGLLVLLMSWLQRQMQWPVETMLASATAVLTGYSFVLPLVQRAVRKHRQQIVEGAADVVLQYVGFLLKTPVLAVLAVVTLVPSLFFSRVTVAAAGVVGPRDLRLYSNESHEPIESAQLLNESDVHTFNVFTTPLGRPMMLKVSGFQHHTLTVMPGIGASVELTRLNEAPAVMLRLPPLALQRNSDGQIKLFRKGKEGSRARLIGVTTTRPGYGSYIFGWFAGEVDEDQAERWQGDLEYAVEANESSVPIKPADVLYKWGRSITTSFASDQEVLPSQFLEAYHLKNPNDPNRVDAFVELAVNGHQALQENMLNTVDSTLVTDVAVRSALEAATVLRLPAARLLAERGDEAGQILLLRRDEERGLVPLGEIATSPAHGTYVFGVPGSPRQFAEVWAKDLADVPEKQRAEVEDLWAEDSHAHYFVDELPDQGLARTASSLEAFYLTRPGDASSLAAHATFEVGHEPVQDHLLTPPSDAKRAELRTVLEGRSR